MSGAQKCSLPEIKCAPLWRFKLTRVYRYTEKFRFHFGVYMIKFYVHFQSLGQRQNPEKQDSRGEHRLGLPLKDKGIPKFVKCQQFNCLVNILSINKDKIVAELKGK